MSFLKTIADKQIHLWVVFIIFVGLLSGAIFWTGFRATPLESFEVTAPNGQKTTLTYGAAPELSNPDFYASVAKDLIEKKTDFIEANLSTMKVRVYQGGQMVKEVPILTKGKKGSWWETPAGLYKVESKIKKHLSSFSPVYTDWNLNFQGNFFIHGWPYWADSGEPVTSTYSGGCIRLSTDDAKMVYDLVATGEPVLVYEDAPTDTYSYQANLPTLTSTSYLAADLSNSFVFTKKDSDTVADLPGAAKLLTALVSTEYMDIERGVNMKGTKYTVYDLLFPLLLTGDEDAAHALRSSLGESYAINLMTQKAKAIGMSHTDISRNDAGVTAATTPEDIFHLAQYLVSYRKFILDLSRNVVTNAAYGPSAFGKLTSSSPLQDMPGYLGGMYESDSQGESALGVFSIDFNGTSRTVAIVLVGSQDVSADAQSMLTYIKSAFK